MFPHQWLFALCSNVLIICITILREYFLRYIFNIINSLMMIKCGSIFGNRFSLFWHMSLGLLRAKIHRPSKTIQSFKKITKITKTAKSFMVILAILSILSRFFFNIMNIEIEKEEEREMREWHQDLEREIGLNKKIDDDKMWQHIWKLKLWIVFSWGSLWSMVRLTKYNRFHI